jgi:dihydrofolate synthase/folylpolyglutamate synthase
MALACLEVLNRFPVDDTAKARGIISARWPARLQRLTDGPLAAVLPDGWELWLDGGHNPAAAQVLADWAASLSDARPLHLISAFLETKDAKTFLQIIAPKAASLHALAPAGEHAYIPAETLAGYGRSLGLEAAASADASAAIKELAQRDGPARILICGSLYLAGEVLAKNG